MRQAGLRRSCDSHFSNLIYCRWTLYSTNDRGWSSAHPSDSVSVTFRHSAVCSIIAHKYVHTAIILFNAVNQCAQFIFIWTISVVCFKCEVQLHVPTSCLKIGDHYMVHSGFDSRHLIRIICVISAGWKKIRLEFRLAVFFSAEFRLTYLRLIFRLAALSVCRLPRGSILASPLRDTDSPQQRLLRGDVCHRVSGRNTKNGCIFYLSSD